MNEYKIVALMPLKAESQRVKNKNFRILGDKPLFHWVYDKLNNLSDVEKIIINTDAEEKKILDTLKDSSKLIIRKRASALIGHEISMNKILQDDIRDIKSSIYLMTHSTNPLISIRTIEQAIVKFKEILIEGKYDSLFSVTKVQERFYRGDGSPVNHNPKNLIQTQDLEPWFSENSNLYLFTSSSFNSTNARIGKYPYLFETSKTETIDIDTEDDWSIANKMVSRNEK
jgi:CMP-N-acetylneuraminic acid synthetase